MKYSTLSRENQDLFVLAVLGSPRSGTYLEIGANEPEQDSNTYLLETQFNWRGVSVEFDPAMVSRFRQARSNPCICADARELNYLEVVQQNQLPRIIDYLQLDIDPPQATLQVLESIDFTQLQFRVITYEHDSYRGSQQERDRSRQILESQGYTRVITDVLSNNLPFEDWYVRQELMPNDNWRRFIGSNIPMNTPAMPNEIKQIFGELL